MILCVCPERIKLGLVNYLIEGVFGGFPAECFSGSFGERLLDEAEFLGRDGGEVGSFGEEVADQAVGVFVGSALPGAVRVTEIDGHSRRQGQLGVAGHLFALVIGEGFAQRGGQLLEAPGEGSAG